MRTIRIFSMESGVHKDILTSATTWGALKTEIRANGLNPDDKRAIVKDKAISLELDEAELPEGDLVIMLTPSKVKSGLNN